ncbi:hypothetical protein C8J57DRAFT_1513960 [Mycena rebaudengoi]|nr:hypothetical protein C8J57DRAFT_1513960 [Mycena rebaudengoi]
MADDPYTCEEHPSDHFGSIISDDDSSRLSFFAGAQHFVVTGGQFTSSITHNSINPPFIVPSGRQSDMTVAIYQGENAEENWRRELAKYSGIRHPNFIQLYGTVSSPGLHAIIFHDGSVSSVIHRRYLNPANDP